MGDTSLPVLAVAPGTISAEADHALVRRGTVRRSAPLVSDALHAHARDSRDRVAFREGEQRTTYGQLHDEVARLRSFLLWQGCTPGERVAVSGPRSHKSAVAFLALESIGAVYIPVDRAWPPERLAEVFTQARCTCVLVHRGSAEADAHEAPSPALVRAAADAGAELLQLEEAAECEPSAPPCEPPTDPGDQARYVIYTSGSTGTPKGAVVDHRGMANHLAHMVDSLNLTSGDVVAFTAPPTYVVSIWQMLAAVTAGATVAVIGGFDAANPRRLLKALSEHEVTVAQMVPTMISMFVGELGRRPDGERLPRLRWLISTGEELRPQLAAEVLDTLPHARLLNAYGMSECSDDVAQHVVRRTDVRRPRLPVGRPIANTFLYVLVEHDGVWRPARAGEAGELFVGGVPVGAGYLGGDGSPASFFRNDLNPGLPSSRLYRTGDLACVDDGLVYYLGRSDRQIKIRGLRMELDEVELVLRRHPSLAGCAVTAEAAGESHRLRIYYVAADDVSVRELQEHLRGSLPWAVSSNWVRLDEIPLTSHGKIDYRSLPRSRKGPAG
ncbi:amino acid adenylation domain-containing protein [Streptomyces sp. NPDC017248]|uniref:amino acid adenylation domain-containing protein n=1 Tax=unclassified Streptomyces TaxID=2593676 RepID=UPI00378E7C62